jgi:hypothetical protein
MTGRLLSLVLLSLLLGCGAEGTPMQTWWGPLHVDEGSSFSSGGRFVVNGFGHRVRTETQPARDLLSVALVSGEQEVSCSQYASYLQEIAEVQAYIDGVLALPEAERPSVQEWYPYVCQGIDGAAVEAFGGNGSYKSVQLLIDVSGGSSSGLFRGAAPGDDPPMYAGGELLAPSTFVSRIYERSRHGDAILPEGAGGAWQRDDVNPITGCPGVINVLVSEMEEGRETYPDHSSLALQTASHRYYHLYVAEERVPMESGSLELAVIMPEWDVMAASGADLSMTLFGRVARAPEAFPYTDILVSSQGRTVPIEPCAELDETLPMIWPEVDELVPAGGDDDDAADDDDSAS